jgi:hypothetical protein
MGGRMGESTRYLIILVIILLPFIAAGISLLFCPSFPNRLKSLSWFWAGPIIIIGWEYAAFQFNNHHKIVAGSPGFIQNSLILSAIAFVGGALFIIWITYGRGVIAFASVKWRFLKSPKKEQYWRDYENYLPGHWDQWCCVIFIHILKMIGDSSLPALIAIVVFSSLLIQIGFITAILISHLLKTIRTVK